MVKKVDTAEVHLWGDRVGAVSWLDERGYAVFEYDRAFLNKGLDIAPLHMSLADAGKGEPIFSFPALDRTTFLGLPGLLADALPDKFGNSIIDVWLARQGRNAADFSPVERLCYTGRRGMGALEFSPALVRGYDDSTPLEIDGLVALTREILNERSKLDGKIGRSGQGNADAIADILRIGTSAGGARAKAVIAIDDAGNIRSGQLGAPPGFNYWILKFDGVTDLELGETMGYGRIEYAYHLMARAAGIEMTECRLLEENGRAHFLTRRFDRADGGKLHLQTLCGIAHYDFNMAGAYSYEQVFAVMRRLRLSKAEAAQQYRRMVFNVIARNLDDHTKNISFLMDRNGKWKLSPAYDVIYAHNPAGKWTNRHQMSLNGKRDEFTKGDLIAVGKAISLPKPGAIIDEVADAVKRWPEFAKLAGIGAKTIRDIANHHRPAAAA